MMNFEYAQDTFTATNSIKAVTIRALTEYDYALDMPEGDLYIDAPIMSQWFETFAEAKRWAEHRVGVKFNILEEAVQ